MIQRNIQGSYNRMTLDPSNFNRIVDQKGSHNGRKVIIRPSQLVASQFETVNVGSSTDDHASICSPEMRLKPQKLGGQGRALSTNFSHRDSATVASHEQMVSSQKFISFPISEAARPHVPMRHARLKSAVAPGTAQMR